MIESKLKYLTGFPLFIGSIAVALATFLVVLDYSIANVALPYIAGDLGVSSNEGTYVITSFAVGNAIALPITGWLSKRIGLVKLTVLSILGFVFFSWVCGISFDLDMIVTARFFQGLVSGPLIPLSQTLIVSIFPPEKQSKALSVWSTVVIIAPILGPILGGWITYDYSWPWIFFINIPIGLFAAYVIFIFLQPFETLKEKMPTDWIGLLLLAIGVSCLQFLLDKGEQYDWLNSTIIRICAIASFCSFVYLIAWEFSHPYPILELRLLKIPSYAVSILFIATMYAIYFGGVVLVPLWLQINMGYTPTWAGLAVAPLGLIPALFTGLIAKLVDRIGALIPLALSLIFFALSSFDGAFFNTDIDFFHIALSRFLFGFGLLFFIVPLFSLSIRDVPKIKLPSATGMFHFVRAMMGGVGTSIFTTMWIRRQAFHHSNLVAQVNFTNEPANQLYTQLGQLHYDQSSSQAIVNEMVNQQAAVLSLNDCFFLMGWIFIAMLAILLFARRKQPKPT